MEKGFIKSDKLLMETPKVDDLFNLEEKIKSFSKLLNSINQSGSFGFIGDFGIGKSTFLENVKKTRTDEDEMWVYFDAWKFPERKELWEGFVLDFARQLDKKTFEDVRKKIDGEKGEDMKTLIKVISKGVNLFLPGGNLLENFSHFFKTSPARRVFEIQDILEEIIKKKKKRIFIIIEDIDRSGDSGVYFLETLKYFIDNINFTEKIIAIVPMATDKFEEKKDSFLKSLNFVEFFDFSGVKLTKFVEEVFDDYFLENEIEKKQIISFLEFTFTAIPNMTPRLMKFILRKANFNFKRQFDDRHEPDFRLSIIFEFSKYLKKEGGRTFYDDFKIRGVTRGNIFSKILYMIVGKRNELYNVEGNIQDSPIDFKLVARPLLSGVPKIERFPSAPNTNWVIEDFPNRGDKYFGLCDFYFRY